MSEQNKQVALGFIDAFSRGDAEAAKSYLAEDAMTHAKGFGKLSGPRPYEVIIATTGAFRALIPDGLRPEFRSVTAEGNRVVVEFIGNATLVNGEAYNNEYCMIFTLEGGKIKNVNEYYCTILADAKIGPLLEDIEARRAELAALSG